jgi:hypothetical protein
MRRLTRRLFTFGSVLSLLLCIPVAVVWIDSCLVLKARVLYDRPLDSSGVSVDQRLTVMSWRGAVLVRVGPEYGFPASGFDLLGVKIQSFVGGGYWGYAQYGCIVTLLVLPFVWWVIRRSGPRPSAEHGQADVPAAAAGPAGSSTSG